jgi:hypothetical protein
MVGATARTVTKHAFLACEVSDLCDKMMTGNGKRSSESSKTIRGSATSCDNHTYKRDGRTSQRLAVPY